MKKRKSQFINNELKEKIFNYVDMTKQYVQNSVTFADDIRAESPTNSNPKETIYDSQLRQVNELYSMSPATSQLRKSDQTKYSDDTFLQYQQQNQSMLKKSVTDDLHQKLSSLGGSFIEKQQYQLKSSPLLHSTSYSREELRNMTNQLTLTNKIDTTKKVEEVQQPKLVSDHFNQQDTVVSTEMVELQDYRVSTKTVISKNFPGLDYIKASYLDLKSSQLINYYDEMLEIVSYLNKHLMSQDFYEFVQEAIGPCEYDSCLEVLIDHYSPEVFSALVQHLDQTITLKVNKRPSTYLQKCMKTDNGYLQFAVTYVLLRLLGFICVEDRFRRFPVLIGRQGDPVGVW